jgi:hypothetical protein
LLSVATIPRGLAGTAGEYLVAAQLSLRGWLATVTLKNAPGTDVLAQHQDTGVICAIQTKTMTASKDFRLTTKDERPARGNEWFVLVDLKGTYGDETEYFVLPRSLASAIVYCGHRHWLQTPGRKGQAHNDNTLRAISPSGVDAYRDRWDLLLGPARDAASLISDGDRWTIAKYGRPEDKALIAP